MIALLMLHPNYAKEESIMKFISPIDGDVLFSVADGTVHEGSLLTTVKVAAPAGHTICINGLEACEEDGIYAAPLFLSAYKNTVTAVDMNTSEKVSMVIYWFQNGYKTYRLGVDDVIWALENIWRNQEKYSSIFDDPFMALYRDLHQQYGTPVHMHIYYENDDGSFNLSMFPSKYKEEFRSNGHWLKLSFHSRKDKPNSPYKYASYQQVLEEGQQVAKEILRFAGLEATSRVTSQHFADSNREATRAFRDLGFDCIDGYFQFDKNGETIASYYFDKEQTLHAASRDFWVDHSENILFVKDDIIINEVPLDEIDAFMKRISAEQNHCFHYLLIHEQYFYKDYFAYEPDYRERVFAAVDWCHRHGYRPATITNIALDPGWGRE